MVKLGQCAFVLLGKIKHKKIKKNKRIIIISPLHPFLYHNILQSECKPYKVLIVILKSWI